MARAFYLLCEAITLYVICALLMFGFLYFAGFHFTGDLRTLLVIGMLIVLAPFSWTAVSKGTWVSEGSVDRHAPVRPLAMISPAAVTLRRSSEMPHVGGRQPVRFAFGGGGGIDSIDVIARLSDHLTALGVAHSHVGGIHARDGAVRWELEPAIGARRLEGWVEAPQQADRAAVIAAIADFLKQQLNLDVEVMR